jgi:succinate dehydrogenase / fumarate reductase flavoprotein subunit
VSELDYDCAGQSVHVTNEVDITLIKPRARKYEQAGAASAVAQDKPGDKGADKKTDAGTEKPANA